MWQRIVLGAGAASAGTYARARSAADAASGFPCADPPHGNSPEEPGGLILVGPLAAACSLLALVVYSRYPEREVLSAGSA